MKHPFRTLTAVGLSVLLLTGIVLVSSGFLRTSSAAAPTEAAVQPQTRAAEPAIHSAYVQGENGFFHPDRPITRAQMAQMLYNLGFSAPGEASFADVDPTQWYGPAVTQLSAVLTGYDDGTFRPDAVATLAELVAVLCRTLETDVPAASDDAWYAPYWAAAEANGWLPDAASREDAPATRATAVAVVNRALGRTPDRDAVDALEGVFFVDVRPDHWAYADILEAAVEHRCGDDGSWLPDSWTLTPLTEGVYIDDGVGYYVEASGSLYQTPGILEWNGGSYLVADETGLIWADNAIHPYGNTLVCCAGNGRLLQNNSFQGFYFDEAGFYTSGSDEIDGYVAEILAQSTDASMTQLEKLRAVFDLVRGYGYLGRNATVYDAVMSPEQASAYAAKIFETGKGDCYNFTAAFYYLARALGYDATAVVGTCQYSWSNRAISHAWVEIPMDGVMYLFDPQIENYNLRRGISNEVEGAFRVTYETAHASYYPN